MMGYVHTAIGFSNANIGVAVALCCRVELSYCAVLCYRAVLSYCAVEHKCNVGGATLFSCRLPQPSS